MKVLLLLSVVAAASAGGMPRELAERVMEMSALTDCWGEGNMKTWMKGVEAAADACLTEEQTLFVDDLFDEKLPRGPKASAELPRLPGSAERRRRDANGEWTPEQMKMYAMKIEKLKEEKAAKVSNLTCAMVKMGMWNEDESINIDMFRNYLESDDLVEELDEDFKMAMAKKYEMCYKMVQSFPAEDIPNKGIKRFGKQLKFHKCILKSEKKVCLMKKLADLMEMKYGRPFDPEMAQTLGLPTNRYEAMFMKTLMKPHLTDPTKWFVMEMINHGDSDPFA